MANPEPTFPTDISNPGTSTLDLEVPWLVPESVRFINKLVTSTHRVLDLGSGGSTFFYARRCAYVHAIETIIDYYNVVEQHIKSKQLQHRIDYHCHGNDTIVHHVRSLPDTDFDVISVDTMTGQSRTQLLEAALPKWRGSILVMDNWAHKKLWPMLFGLSGADLLAHLELKDHQVHDFTHSPYKGRGTRVIVANDLL